MLVFDVQFENQYKGSFVYDMGSPYLCMDSLFYNNKNWNHEQIKNIRLGGVGESKTMGKWISDTIRFNIDSKKKSMSSETILLDLKKIFGKNIDGIIGIKSFENKNHKLDYISEKLVFLDTFVGYDKIEAEFVDNRIYVPLKINLMNGEKIEGKFMLDTGSGNTVLNSDNYKINGIYNYKNKAKYFYSGGVGGESKGVSLFVKDIMIGNFNVKNMIVDISTDSAGALSDKSYKGLLGNNLLDDFDVIFNFERKSMWIKPNKKFNKNKKKTFYGFSVIDRTDINKAWIVTSVYEDSNAYVEGLRINDIITHIGNKSVEEIDKSDFFKHLRPNQNLSLKVTRKNAVVNIAFRLNVFLSS